MQCIDKSNGRKRAPRSGWGKLQCPSASLKHTAYTIIVGRRSKDIRGGGERMQLLMVIKLFSSKHSLQYTVAVCRSRP